MKKYLTILLIMTCTNLISMNANSSRTTCQINVIQHPAKDIVYVDLKKTQQQTEQDNPKYIAKIFTSRPLTGSEAKDCISKAWIAQHHFSLQKCHTTSTTPDIMYEINIVPTAKL